MVGAMNSTDLLLLLITILLAAALIFEIVIWQVLV
jgi:hypothetical protein